MNTSCVHFSYQQKNSLGIEDFVGCDDTVGCADGTAVGDVLGKSEGDADGDADGLGVPSFRVGDSVLWNGMKRRVGTC